MRVLIIKLSSMGDIIHTLPALTDAVIHHPQLSFDWLIDESFAEIPSWHSAVKDIIPIALRQTKKNLFHTGRLRNSLKLLRKTKYDLIIDAQGLIKSALFTKLARGPRAGLAWASARESIASLFYQKKYVVDATAHAVTRTRHLFAQALGYAMPTHAAEYGIKARFASAQTEAYLLFLHGTTWPTKHWPESFWRALASLADANNMKVKIPFGNKIEEERAKRIAQNFPHVIVLPKMNLAELATELANARACISVDTGLAHLAAALDTPTISLYGPTNPLLTGTHGKRQLHLAAKQPSCAPCLQEQCKYRGRTTVFPACFADITPEKVWAALEAKFFVKSEMPV